MPTRSLPVPLTDPDRLAIQRDLTDAIDALEQTKDEKRAATSTHNTNIKAHESRIHELNTALKTGSIDREVEVTERPDFARGVVLIVRADTGDVCAERAMDPDERQLMLGKQDEREEGAN